jgi:hypothetical protein
MPENPKDFGSLGINSQSDIEQRQKLYADRKEVVKIPTSRSEPTDRSKTGTRERWQKFDNEVLAVIKNKFPEKKFRVGDLAKASGFTSNLVSIAVSRLQRKQEIILSQRRGTRWIELNPDKKE